MKIRLEKILVRKTMRQECIGQWAKPHGYELSCVAITVPVFKTSLNIAYGSYAEFKKFLRDKFDNEPKHSNAGAMVSSFEHENKQWHWMNIQSMEWFAEDYGTIAHELHHYTHFTLGIMGIEYSDKSEETFAYFQGHMMELVIRAFSTLRKKKDRKRKHKKK